MKLEMKEIKISVKRQKKELMVFLVCLLIAFCLNIYAIIAYDGKWSELFWSLGFVCAAAIVLYMVWAVLRLVYCYTKKPSKNKK